MLDLQWQRWREGEKEEITSSGKILSGKSQEFF